MQHKYKVGKIRTDNRAKIITIAEMEFAASKILEVHGQRMLDRTFDPGFRICLHQKDLNLALTTGREINAVLPNTATAQELFTSCASYGLQDSDHSAMVQALEGMANHQLVPDKAP